jgi:hypothetical protein
MQGNTNRERRNRSAAAFGRMARQYRNPPSADVTRSGLLLTAVLSPSTRTRQSHRSEAVTGVQGSRRSTVPRKELCLVRTGPITSKAELILESASGRLSRNLLETSNHQEKRRGIGPMRIQSPYRRIAFRSACSSHVRITARESQYVESVYPHG